MLGFGRRSHNQPIPCALRMGVPYSRQRVHGMLNSTKSINTSHQVIICVVSAADCDKSKVNSFTRTQNEWFPGKQGPFQKQVAQFVSAPICCHVRCDTTQIHRVHHANYENGASVNSPPSYEQFPEGEIQGLSPTGVVFSQAWSVWIRCQKDFFTSICLLLHRFHARKHSGQSYDGDKNWLHQSSSPFLWMSWIKFHSIPSSLKIEWLYPIGHLVLAW